MMCLETVEFKMKRINNEIIGIGYKHIDKYCLDSLGRLNFAKLKYHEWTKGWSRASYTSNIFYGNDYYPSGFHIFLKKEDADNYVYPHNFGCTVQVEFKDIIAFGTNKLFNTKQLGNCIIADQMRIIGKV